VFISPDQVLAIHSRVLLGDVLARRVPVSAFWRYRVPAQRKKRCQQIIGLDDESLSIAVRIDTKKKSVLGKMFGRCRKNSPGYAAQ
jgi:hypothetical protein